MKTKLMLAMAVAVFAGSFGMNSARAEDPACVRGCILQYQACVAATPDKQALCWAYRTRCMKACGVFN